MFAIVALLTATVSESATDQAAYARYFERIGWMQSHHSSMTYMLVHFVFGLLHDNRLTKQRVRLDISRRCVRWLDFDGPSNPNFVFTLR